MTIIVAATSFLPPAPLIDMQRPAMLARLIPYPVAAWLRPTDHTMARHSDQATVPDFATRDGLHDIATRILVVVRPSRRRVTRITVMDGDRHLFETAAATASRRLDPGNRPTTRTQCQLFPSP